MSKQPLIYVGRCLTTNKVYVGSTKQGKRRALSHIRDLNKGTHSNKVLQRAWDKYGADDFTWHVVEACEPNQLLAREQWWIGFLRAAERDYGFNLIYPVADIRNAIASALAKTQIEKWRDPEIRRKRLTGLKKLHKDPEWKDRRAQSMKQRWADPKWRAKMLKVLAKNVDVLVDRNANEPGFKQHRMRGIQPGKS